MNAATASTKGNAMPRALARALTAVVAMLLAPATHAMGDRPPDDALHAAIEAADRVLFGAIFDRCDADEVGRLVTEDLEFFHDKWGRIAKSRAEFVDSIRGLCARQAAGTDPRARREPIAGTMKVWPMKGYGALQSGDHRFFQIHPGRGAVLTETAKYTQLWRREGDRWLLARVFSYDHVDAPGR